MPDNPFELGNFYNACKGHDCCYGRCGSEKATCDSNFYNDMVAACQAKWPGDGVLDVAGQYWCEQVARVYYNAVANDPQGTGRLQRRPVLHLFLLHGLQERFDPGREVRL